MSQPTVSAVVVSYHTGRRLRDCLNILAFDPDVDESLIIDNGNPIEDADWIDQFCAAHASVRSIRPGDNLGFGRAANLAAKAASGDWLVFVNPDALVARGAIVQLIAAGQSSRKTCLVGGKLFGLDGQEQRGARRRELTWTTALGLQSWTLETTNPPLAPISMPVVSGAFFAIERNAFLDLDGGFDERFFLHVEDVDLCRRVRASGGDVLYVPGAAALHIGATSNSPSSVVARYKADSLGLYFQKWAQTPIDHLLNFCLLPGLKWWVQRKADR